MKLRKNMRVNSAGHLEIGGCDTVDLAREFGTPLYVLDEELLRSQCRAYRNELSMVYPDSMVIYASKALMNMAVCRIIDDEGLGLDVVSGGELYTAFQAGFPMEKVFFHGNNKSSEELGMALEYGVGIIVVDNLYELENLNSLAVQKGKKVSVLFRLTPGVEAHTHSYTQTGQQDSKFGLGIQEGVAFKVISHALTLPGIEVKGVHCHIGSQIFDIEPYKMAVKVMFEFLGELKRRTGFEAEILDMGGGLGIVYHEGDQPATIESCVRLIGNAVKEEAQNLNYPLPKLVLEPGRSLVGEAGTTLYTIGSIKELPGIRCYVAVNGGMADNPRVALYQAEYEGLIANKADQKRDKLVTITGKCCESGDMLIWDILIAPPQPGDIMAIFSTGAYNYSMASNYNRLPRPAMVIVQNGKADLIVARETYQDLISLDRIPDRIGKLAAISGSRS